MLVVTRKRNEKLIIGDNIEVQVLRIGRENVRLGIKAPADVSIYRSEVYDAIQLREKAAAEAEGSEAAVPDAASSEASAPETDAGAEQVGTPPAKPSRSKAQSNG